MEFDRGESWLPEILVTVAVERVFTLYMMQDAVREMTIYMNTCIVHNELDIYLWHKQISSNHIHRQYWFYHLVL